jgi:dTDP-glucose 4,6-dehydratase
LSRALISANQVFDLNLELNFLSRSINSSQLKRDFGSNYNLRFWEFDLADEKFISAIDKEFHVIFHGATASKFDGRKSNDRNAEIGTSNLISFVSKNKSVPSFINLSSGAVYGIEARSSPFILESSKVPNKNEVFDSYVAEKIAIELLISEANQQKIIHGSSPRLFAFYGNGLPIDANFAIGNFMRDIIFKKSLQITGSPESTRSYMHVVELVLSLIKLSVHPIPGSVNIGGSEAISMQELANKLMSILEITVPIIFNNEGTSPNHYVPGFDLSHDSLVREQFIDFSSGIKSWATALNA